LGKNPKDYLFAADIYCQSSTFERTGALGWFAENGAGEDKRLKKTRCENQAAIIRVQLDHLANK